MLRAPNHSVIVVNFKIFFTLRILRSSDIVMDAYQESTSIDYESTDTTDQASNNRQPQGGNEDQFNFVLQPDSNVIMSPIEPANDIKTTILDLNDDCLLEIFSSKLLNPLDLCALAETCMRFNRLTQYACPRYFKNGIGYYGCIYKFLSNNHSNYTSTRRSAERILQTFGPCFSTVSMQQDPAVVNWVVRHCSNDDSALKTLEMHRFSIDESVVTELRSIFRRLMALHITSSNIRTDTYTDFSCAKLVELGIVNVANCDLIFNNTFPMLQRFTFADDEYDGTAALTFIGRHNSLKTLTLDARLLYRMYDFKHVISHSCKELEELTLRKFDSRNIAPDFSSVEGPTKLTLLSLTLGYQNYSHIVALLRTYKSLEIVKLSMGLLEGNVHGVLAALSELRNLRELHLTNCFYKRTAWTILNRLKKLCLFDSMFPFPSDVLLSVINELPNLDELEIRTEFALSEEEFSEIVKIVERRTKVLMITSRIEFSKNFLKNCNRNGKIKLIKLD